MGDHIILESIKEQMNDLLSRAFVVEISTHFPLSLYMRLVKYVDYRFVCGSNLLSSKMNSPFSQWDVKMRNLYVGPCVLVGAGWKQYEGKPNLATKRLYKKTLSTEYMHSVRDSFTAQQLKSIGINNVINTSCPTMWNLTQEHCAQIPVKKSNSVVTTITDYSQNEKRDKMMLDILSGCYEKVYLWQQGIRDGEYVEKLGIKNSNIELIAPTLDAFDNVLKKDIDYVGTRLHAGIRALQKKKRTLIVAIDNRAVEKQKDFNLPCVSCNNLSDLKNIIESQFITDIKIPIENIQRWKSQFLENLNNNGEI